MEVLSVTCGPPAHSVLVIAVSVCTCVCACMCVRACVCTCYTCVSLVGLMEVNNLASDFRDYYQYMCVCTYVEDIQAEEACLLK